MRSFKYSSIAMLALAAAFATSSANAGLIPPLTTGANQLEDDDFELFLDLDQNGIVSVGDRFFGVFRIQGINTVLLDPADNTITSVFAVEVVGSNGTGTDPGSANATELTFAPLQSAGGANDAIAQWTALTAALGVSTTLPTDNNTAAIIYDNPSLGGTSQFGGIPGSVDTFDETAGSLVLAELGDLGVTFDWRTTGLPGVDNPANVVDPAFPSRNVINLDVVKDTDDLIEWGPWEGVGSFIPPNITDPGSWQLATDTDFVAQARIIPEPASGAVFLGMVAAACFGARRRRKSA